MKNQNILIKTLAIVGTVMVWFPLLAPVFFGIVAFIGRGRFLFDFLMPAELFPFALAGSLLLLWASFRTHSHLKLIAWSLGLAVALLVGSQTIAVVTGLASGAIEPSGFWFILVLTVFAGFVAALTSVAVGGILMLRDVFRKPQIPTATD